MNKHLSNVAFFLLWIERSDPNAMWGGIKVSDSIDSLSMIIGCKPEELRGLIE